MYITHSCVISCGKMSNKLALDTLITALACLTSKIDLKNAFPQLELNTPSFNLRNENLFCDTKNHLEVKLKDLERQREQNERNLLQLELKFLQSEEQNRKNADENELLPFDCENLSDGVHKLNSSSLPFYTICEERSMLILQYYGENNTRQHSLEEAAKGFGILHDDFFIGLDRVYTLVNDNKYKALVVLKTSNYETLDALYTEFKIKEKNFQYAIAALSHCRGDGCDILGKPEKRFNRDNCKKTNKQFWWDFSCNKSLFIKVYLMRNRNVSSVTKK